MEGRAAPLVGFFRLRIIILLLFVFLDGCVDRIVFPVAPAQLQTVIDGMISDQPGPYTVKISQAIDLNADSIIRVPVPHANVKLHDDEGNVENYAETAPGDYATGGLIRGKVGHSYYVTVETDDGVTFQSEPDLMKPVGEIDEIKFEFEARTKEEPYGIVQRDIFKVLIDARSVADDENYVRWRFKGTYKVFSYPELHFVWNSGFKLKDPYPCSGFIVGGGPTFSGGILTQVGPCTCCTCWGQQFESQPQLSDGQLVVNNQFKNIQVGEVPINTATFYDKYLVEVEQMSMSKKAFEFFKLIRSQKEGVSSLFQPPSGEIKGNFKAVNSTAPVIGLFWATSIKSKSIYIRRSDVPYGVPPIPEIRYPCTWYPNAVNVKPSNWED